MSVIKINLEEIFKNNFNKTDCFIDYDKEGLVCIKRSMLEFGKQLLELAAENAKVRTISQVTGDPVNMEDWEYRLYKVDGPSILDTIKQVE